MVLVLRCIGDYIIESKTRFVHILADIVGNQAYHPEHRHAVKASASHSGHRDTAFALRVGLSKTQPGEASILHSSWHRDASFDGG